MTGGLLDFFTLEATEYVDQLDGLASRAVGAPPDAGPFARAARALRGSATMARLSGIAEVAGGLERLARHVREGQLPWDPATRGVAVAAIDDLKILIRGVRSWGAAEETRAGARIAELERLAPRTVTTKPRGRGSAYLSASAADAAAGLLEYAEQPGSPDAFAEVMKRVRALRGVAALKDLPPLADVVDAVDAAAKPIEIGHDAATAERRRLFRAAARVLVEGGEAVRRGDVPPVDSPALREFVLAVETLRANQGDADEVVPISSLLPDDAPDAIRAAPNPPTTAAQRFRLEVVSQAEHLRRLVLEARGARDGAAHDRIGRELRAAVRTLARAAQSFAAIEISNVFLAAERGAAALESRSLGVLEEAARVLTANDIAAESVAPRFLELAQVLAGTPSTGITAVGGGRASGTRQPTPWQGVRIPTPSGAATLPSIDALAPATAPAPRTPTPARPAEPVRAPTPAAPAAAVRTPTPSSAPSGAALHSLLGSGIAGLSPLGDDRLIPPVVGEEDDVVPIEEILLSGREALERARAIGAELRESGRVPDRETLDELYDLLQLAAAE